MLRWVRRVPMNSGDSAEGVAILGDYAYFMDAGLRVLDVRHPAAPREVKTVEAPADCRVSQALTVDERNRLLNCVYIGLWVFDLVDPSTPRVIWSADKAGIWQAGPGAVFESHSYDDIILVDDIAYTITQDWVWPKTVRAAAGRPANGIRG